jgi:hypothetical protein
VLPARLFNRLRLRIHRLVYARAAAAAAAAATVVAIAAAVDALVVPIVVVFGVVDLFAAGGQVVVQVRADVVSKLKCK